MAAKPVSVAEFQELARQALPKMNYDFYTAAAEDLYTLKENEEAFHRITLIPRVLQDVSRVDMATTILGYPFSAPILIAPTAMHKLAHHRGELATARAAATCKTIMVLSMSSTYSIEEVAASCNAVRFFQLYVIIARVIVVLNMGSLITGMTIPKLKNLEGLISNEVFSEKGSKVEAYANSTHDPSFCWKVVHAVGGKVPVLLDGGIRRGTDVFKALALGAQAVLVGRPVIYGLAVKGEDGVREVMQMLKDELELTMALSGCPSLKHISRNHVRTQQDRLQSML
ncbi:hypothetical protein Tsubulata_037579 [Turnera subulata]|uniref:FMN hydroxy acid dehydrogenase domain-containing protein n=1 Tax=Turnera subulata TaxID=218843 RepID=A0A9Q0FQV5_9ROSI|nr:hypothetical protein Tsubulata_037579 [Turnera subulata]